MIFLKAILPPLREYLQTELALELHPDKIHLQEHRKGVRFLGTIVKPYRVYIHSRTKTGFYRTLRDWNNIFERNGGRFSPEESAKFAACVNSYLGLMRHYNTYNLRKKMLTTVMSKQLRAACDITPDYTKISPRR